MGDPVWLESPSRARKAAFLRLCDELAAGGTESGLQRLAQEDFEGYLSRVQDMAAGRNLAPDLVPMSIYWLLNGEQQVAGESRFRHVLNADLEVEGGNIGYVVRPSLRRRGYGTRILALTLEKARERGLSRVLVTCDTDNIASARIIEKSGGVPSEPARSPESGKAISRYWIELRGRA